MESCLREGGVWEIKYFNNIEIQQTPFHPITHIPAYESDTTLATVFIQMGFLREERDRLTGL